MKEKYEVIILPNIYDNIINITKFISNISLTASKRFVSDLEVTIDRININPYMFQKDFSYENTDYRRALLSKWYKIVFEVDEKNKCVYIDAIVDIRMQ